VTSATPLYCPAGPHLTKLLGSRIFLNLQGKKKKDRHTNYIQSCIQPGSPESLHIMADDGMILNFAVPTGPILQRTVLKGGPWRERRRVGLKQKNRLQEARDQAPEVDQRPQKRPRVDFDRPTPSLQPYSALRADRPVISSLFTSNPATKIIFEDNDKPTLPQRDILPSNAPLTSEQLTFTSLGLDPRIAIHLTEKLSITAPTAIQKASIPAALKNNDDLFIQAQTGSGKTLAYLLPIIHHILSLTEDTQRDSGLFALILAPTRELCKQIYAVLESALRFTTTIVAGHVMGGEKKKSEKARLRKGMNILVATPGRLADHLGHTKALDFSSVRWLVLDEGDRLMELGFEEDIKKITNLMDFRLKNPKSEILESLPPKRINILCSATMRGDVEKLGEISLKEAQHITSAEDHQITQTNLFTVPAQLKQQYVIVPAKLRLVALYALLKKSLIRSADNTKIIVFFSCAHSVDYHFRVFTRTPMEMNLEETKFTNLYQPPELPTSKEAHSLTSNLTVTVFRLHGSLTQQVRTTTLAAFSKCQGPAVLLSTDIASRGLDLPNVDRVIEYDPAFSREEHLHRVGRTARAGNEGHASVFLMPGCEEGYISVLRSERETGETGLNLKALSTDQLLRSAFPDTTSTTEKPSFLVDNTLQPWEQVATDYQLNAERWVLESPAVLESARKAYQSHVRAYATHVKDEREWFDMKELHLGHLAKAFGLRDRPGRVNMPGMRTSAGVVKADRKKAGSGARSKGVANDEAPVEFKASRAKMIRMGKMGASADEFNIG
jgi:ATP-dependent RNA helicase DDX31/DBP7